MKTSTGSDLNTRYTGLSDRFRSLWTFYQFLGGVFKHQDRGPLPVSYDFQALYRRVQALLPLIGDGTRSDPEAIAEFEHLEREIRRIHGELAGLERDFPPSLLRGFFDHLKNQDEKILYALVKFYLLDTSPDKDTFDKLDILLTRVAQVPSDGGPSLVRDSEELQKSFSHLADLAVIPGVPPSEERALVSAIREIKSQVQAINDFGTLLDSKIVERFRELKERLGAAAFHPPILIEIVAANIEVKNRFRELYQEEEVRILEDTNRVFEIERYIERNPGVAHEELRRQLETFRVSRERFDAGRRENNVRRQDVGALRRSMQRVLGAFEPGRTGGEPAPLKAAATPSSFFDEGTRVVEVAGAAPAEVVQHEPDPVPATGGANGDMSSDLGPPPDPTPGPFGPPADDDVQAPVEIASDDFVLGETEDLGLLDLLPPDPLLTTALHKIVFALELVVWDRPVEQAGSAKEIHHLRLEPWEVGSYQYLVSRHDERGTLAWELQVFLLSSAALRVKMEEEISELSRLSQAGKAGRLVELQERAAQSLERAREIDRRFRWFIDDMLFQGATERLEQIYRSHYRFLHAILRPLARAPRQRRGDAALSAGAGHGRFSGRNRGAAAESAAVQRQVQRQDQGQRQMAGPEAGPPPRLRTRLTVTVTVAVPGSVSDTAAGPTSPLPMNQPPSQRPHPVEKLHRFTGLVGINGSDPQQQLEMRTNLEC